MQIPWYIGWPIVIAFGFGILFMVASRAPYYPIKYPSGFWELQSQLGAEDVWLVTSDGVRLPVSPRNRLAVLLSTPRALP